LESLWLSDSGGLNSGKKRFALCIRISDCFGIYSCGSR